MPKSAQLDYLDRVWSVAHDACVLWPFKIEVKGYGVVWSEGRHRKAHVVSLEHTSGPCPPGLQARHLCSVKACVNPRHLRWGTPAEDAADSADKNRSRKLREDEVAEIRSRLVRGETQRVIALDYGVHQTTVSLISRDRTWRAA